MNYVLLLQLSKLGFTITSLLCMCLKTVESKCETECNLGLASYYVQSNQTLDIISSYFNNYNRSYLVDIKNYNRDEIPDVDSIKVGSRINVPFSCGCVNDEFLGHVFSYVIEKGDNYSFIAKHDYSNLTTWSLIQGFNGYDPTNLPIGAIINVPVNCSCGKSSVSTDYGLFITYPLRVEDSLSSISKHFGLTESLLQGYNPGANFSSGDGIVYIPGKDENGNYPPMVLRNNSSASGLSTGAIVGICVVTVVIVILSVGVYLRCIRTKRLKKASSLLKTASVGHVGGASNILGIDVENSVEFSYEELAKATDDFNLSYKIGEGGFGAVYFAELRGEINLPCKSFSIQKAAIKKMDMQASKEFMAELKVLTHVDHINLVRLLGYCVEGSLFLVYEYIENGNLSQHLHNSEGDPLQWTTRVQIALDSARGLEYIHEHTVPMYIHRDIKPANILINKKFQAKVADFGLAKLSDVGNTLPTRLVGTFGYMPPEYAQFGKVTPKVDVFAFGVVLYELISAKEAVVKRGDSAFEFIGLADLFEDVLSMSDPDEISTLVDPRLGDNYPLEIVRQVAELAKACTQTNPQLRPSMKSVVVALTCLYSATGNWDTNSFF